MLAALGAAGMLLFLMVLHLCSGLVRRVHQRTAEKKLWGLGVRACGV